MRTLSRAISGMLGLTVILGLAVLVGCKGEQTSPQGTTQPATPGVPAATKPPPSEFEPPDVDTSQLPFALQAKIAGARREVREEPDNAVKLADLGALCYVNGFPDAAVICFQRSAELDPGGFNRWYFVGLAQEKAGNPEAAINAYERTIALNDQHRPTSIRLGALLLEKDPARAEEQFRAVVESGPNRNLTAAYIGLGRCAQKAGRLDEAAEQYRNALRLSPSFGPAHAALAEVLDAQGKTEEAEAHRWPGHEGEDRIRPLHDGLEAELLQAGKDVQALVSAAQFLSEQRQYQQAEKALREAMDIDGSNLLARNTYAIVLKMQGRNEEAAREFEAILSLPDGKDYTPAKINLALTLLSTQQLDRAEGLLRETLEEEPVNGDALSVFCTLAAMRQSPDMAMPVLNAALEAAPREAAVHHKVAVLLRDLGKPVEAQEAVMHAIELAPNSTEARETLAVWLLQDGNLQGAREQWTEALRTNPTLIRPRAGLMALLNRDKDYAGALKLLRDGLAVMPNSPYMMNYLAWQLATCPDADYRNSEEAVKLAETACAATGGRDHTMLDTLAAAYASAGRFEDARQTIAKAIAVAKMANAERDLQQFAARLELYKQDQPYYVER